MEDNDYISDELLAAYLDGNTDKNETLAVLKALKTNPELREIVETVLEVDKEESYSYDTLPMMKLAAESGNNICSVLCEAFVLHRRSIPFDEKEMLYLAQKNNWLTPQGSPLHSIGQLLAHYGLMVTRKYDATTDDINKALSLDNDVLLVIDSDKLHPELPDEEDAPNHAVVVIGIDTDTIQIYDPQYQSTDSYELSTFLRAWNESQNYMVRVLQSVNDYEPQPINLDNIRLTDDLLDLQEAIAENAHEVWAAARMKDGWSYGPERDDANKKHPDLIPYSSLPDSEKEYDRIMAFNTIKLVEKLGFNLVKRNKMF